MTQIASLPPNPTPPSSRLPSPPLTALWPQTRVEALTRAWREGLSASQIAARLGGGLTRSAVIGKLHRLGLCGGRKPSPPRAAAGSESAALSLRARPGPVSSKIVWLEPVLDADLIATRVGAGSGSPPSAPGAKYLRDMGPRECRYGLGDPGVGAGHLQLFCAAPTRGHAYCAHHRAIAILPPEPLEEQKVIVSGFDTRSGGQKRYADRRQRGVAP